MFLNRKTTPFHIKSFLFVEFSFSYPKFLRSSSVSKFLNFQSFVSKFSNFRSPSSFDFTVYFWSISQSPSSSIVLQKGFSNFTLETTGFQSIATVADVFEMFRSGKEGLNNLFEMMKKTKKDLKRFKKWYNLGSIIYLDAPRKFKTIDKLENFILQNLGYLVRD